MPSPSQVGLAEPQPGPSSVEDAVKQENEDEEEEVTEVQEDMAENSVGASTSIVCPKFIVL